MASEGPLTPGTQSGWTNSGNVTSSNNVYATDVVPGLSDGATLTLTNFGFAIPSGSTIEGIEVKIEAKASNASSIEISWVSLLNVAGSANGGGGGTITTSDATYQFGHSTDLWAASPTDTDINSSSFGVEVYCSNANASSRTVSFDLVTITVYYSAPPQLPRVSACGASAYGQVSQRPRVTACGASVYGDTVAAGGFIPRSGIILGQAVRRSTFY